MDVEIRTVTDAEFPAWVEAMRVGFHGHAVDGEAESRLVGTDLERTWAAFDGQRIVATLRSLAAELTVPGGVVPVAALTNVTVNPTHRRRGLLSRMITADHQASVARGEVAGILIASEYPIYGRFGYGPAADSLTITLDVPTARFEGAASGSVEMVDLGALRKVGPPLYEQFRLMQPGAITRTERWWDTTCELVEAPDVERWKGFVVVSRDADGHPDGYVRYRTEPHWDHQRADGTLHVQELLATTPDAYRRLWRYCCDVDWMRTVEAGDRRPDEPLRWLLADGRAMAESGRWDFLWVRPFAVAALLSARTYDVDGHLAFEVTDPQGIAAGRFELDATRGRGECRASTAAPELTLPVDVVGALSLGGRSLHELAVAGRVTAPESVLARADTLFRTTVTPWCSTWF